MGRSLSPPGRMLVSIPRRTRIWLPSRPTTGSGRRSLRTNTPKLALRDAPLPLPWSLTLTSRRPFLAQIVTISRIVCSPHELFTECTWRSLRIMASYLCSFRCVAESTMYADARCSHIATGRLACGIRFPRIRSYKYPAETKQYSIQLDVDRHDAPYSGLGGPSPHDDVEEPWTAERDRDRAGLSGVTVDSGAGRARRRPQHTAVGPGLDRAECASGRMICCCAYHPLHSRRRMGRRRGSRPSDYFLVRPGDPSYTEVSGPRASLIRKMLTHAGRFPS